MPAQAKLIEILLVEDNASDIELTRQVFESSKVGNHLSVVTNGDEALDFIYQRNKYQNGVRPDIVLLDLNLPSKDGHEILKIMRSNPSTKTIPVVVLTGGAIDTRLIDESGAQANCYLTKPVTFLSFIGAIQSLEEFWLGLVALPKLDSSPKLVS